MMDNKDKDVLSQGRPEAMLEMSDYLREQSKKDDFYEKGADMWLIRAMLYGSREARKRVRENPGCFQNSLIPYENFLPGKRVDWHHGCYDGFILNKAGLLAFDKDGCYLLEGISKLRVSLAWREADYDEPDEYGFGAEWYYDMFYLDEFFQPLPGIAVLHCVSTRDIENGMAEPYAAMHKAMLNYVREKEAREQPRPLYIEDSIYR